MQYIRALFMRCTVLVLSTLFAYIPELAADNFSVPILAHA